MRVEGGGAVRVRGRKHHRTRRMVSGQGADRGHGTLYELRSRRYHHQGQDAGTRADTDTILGTAHPSSQPRVAASDGTG